MNKGTRTKWSVMGTAAILGWFAPSAMSQSWQPLFNGRDFSGWVIKAKTNDQAKTFWKIEEGVIVADSLKDGQHDYVWLMTEKEYGDFILRLKFQAFKESPGNSGVQIRSRYDDQEFWLHGPQVDIHPPGPWRTGMIWDETRGNQRWLYPPVPKGTWVKPEMARPNLKFYYHTDQPAWNEMEITAQGTRLQAVLNGVTVMEYDGAGVLDDETHRQRRVGLQGHIALQIHTKDRLLIKFKDIEIKELKKE